MVFWSVKFLRGGDVGASSNRASAPRRPSLHSLKPRSEAPAWAWGRLKWPDDVEPRALGLNPYLVESLVQHAHHLARARGPGSSRARTRPAAAVGATLVEFFCPPRPRLPPHTELSFSTCGGSHDFAPWLGAGLDIPVFEGARRGSGWLAGGGDRSWGPRRQQSRRRSLRPHSAHGASRRISTGVALG